MTTPRVDPEGHLCAEFSPTSGRKYLLESLLLKPGNSLINQALDPERYPELQLAGWGFGIWSEHLLKPEDPFIYRRPMAAFYDDNVERIIPSLQASTMLAHVRAADYDAKLVLADENCHPFSYRRDPLDRCPERRPAELEALAAGAAAALQGQVPGADAGHDRHGVPLRASALPARERQRRGCPTGIRGDGAAHRPGDEGPRSRGADQAEDGPGFSEPDHRGQLRLRTPRRDRSGRGLERATRVRSGHG